MVSVRNASRHNIAGGARLRVLTFSHLLMGKYGQPAIDSAVLLKGPVATQSAAAIPG